MAAHKQDINDFHSRIKRIKNPRIKSYYDPDMGMHVPKRISREKIRRNKQEDSFLGAFLVSMILGAVGLMIAQVLRIRYFGLTETGNTTLYLEIFVAFWVVVLLTAMMNKRKVTERIAQIAGVALMFAAGHNLIWRWPDQMAVIYTPAHVEQVMASTTQNSVVFRGSVYGL